MNASQAESKLFLPIIYVRREEVNRRQEEAGPMRRGFRRAGTLLVFLGALLIAAALFTLWQNWDDDRRAGEQSAQALQGLTEAMQQPAQTDTPQAADHPAD